MAVGYLTGGSPYASQLNQLTTELDSMLSMLYSGKSPLIYGVDWSSNPDLFGKVFWFGDPAQRKIYSAVTDEYDHSVYTTEAASLTLDDQDDTRKLAYSDSNDPWTLDDSLEAHTTQIDPGTGLETYWWSRRQPLTLILTARERYRRLDVAEIVVEGWDHSADLDWDAAWNKYHFLRFHNLDPETLIVNLPGSVELAIPPFGCKAVRRTYPHVDEWDTTYTYLWKAISGDQLIIDGVRANNVASLLCYHSWLNSTYRTQVGGTPKAFQFDPRVVWDGTRMLPRAFATDCRIGELLYHLGDVLSFDDADTTATSARATIGSWSALELAAGVGGVTATASGSTLTISAATGMTAPVDAMGISTNILPATPVTLPHVNTQTLQGFSNQATGLKTSSLTITARYRDPADIGIVYEVDATETKGVRSLWSIPTVTTWGNDLDDATTMTDDGTAGTQQVTAPSISWSSDGWRIVGSGTTTLPAHAGYALTQTELRTATFTATTVTLPYGGNIVTNRDVAQDPLFSSHFTREISDYVGFTDIFDQVYYLGHPDAGDEEGSAGGEDFEVTRQSNTASEVARDELASNQAATRNLPVYVLNDTADRVLANYSTAGWYLANRADAQSVMVDDEEKLVRVKVMAAHYNRVAQRLNAVTHIFPIQATDVAYYGDIVDGSWPFAGSMRPTGFLAEVLSTGSRVDELGITVSSITIGATTGYYVTVANWLTWVDSMGLTYQSWRLGTPHTEPSNTYPYKHSTNTASGWRDYSADSVWVGAFATDNDTSELCPPVAWFNESTPNGDFPPGPVWVSEYASEHPAAPTGWEMATDDRLLIYPREHVQFADDPFTTIWGDIDGHRDYESEVIPAISASPEFVLRSALTGDITAAQCASRLDDSLTDGREGFCVSLCPRFCYRRTP